MIILHKNYKLIFLKIENTINFLVTNKISFAVYKFPNSKSIYLMVDENSEKETGFIIQEFVNTKKNLLIRNDIFLKNNEIDIKNVKHLKKNNIEDKLNRYNFFNQNEFEQYVSDIVQKCKHGVISKTVASRIIKKNKPKDFNIGRYFIKLSNNYVNTFANLYYHPKCGLWTGATPELLIQKTKENSFETYSLAGTKLISKNRDWTKKELEEQQIVTNYISLLLKMNNCKSIKIGKTKDILAGKIAHLISEINFGSTKNIQDIAKILHPTPAVCGIPLQKSYDIIKKAEGNQREIYTGFIGVTTKANQKLYVNLRCMQVLKNDLLIYVGAGITKDSIPKDEWFETKNKSQTLLKCL